jgi:hypothetical protein
VWLRIAVRRQSDCRVLCVCGCLRFLPRVPDALPRGVTAHTRPFRQAAVADIFLRTPPHSHIYNLHHLALAHMASDDRVSRQEQTLPLLLHPAPARRSGRWIHLAQAPRPSPRQTQSRDPDVGVEHGHLTHYFGKR